MSTKKSSQVFDGLVDVDLYVVRSEWGGLCRADGVVLPAVCCGDSVFCVGWHAAVAVFRRALLRRPDLRFDIDKMWPASVLPALADGLHMLSGAEIMPLSDIDFALSLSVPAVPDVFEGRVVSSSWSEIEEDAYWDACGI